MELFLIRHAQSANNAKPESERVPDPPLTDLGHEQASQLARRINSIGLTRLITSPFLRTLQTADKIRSETSINPEVRIELHEEGGCYSGHLPSERAGQPGLNRAQIRERFPDFDIAAELDGEGWWRSQPFESRTGARRRAATVLERTHREFARSTECVAFVMHADIMLLFLRSACPTWHPIDTPCNASITKIHVTERGFELAEYNRVDHLTPGLATY